MKCRISIRTLLVLFFFVAMLPPGSTPASAQKDPCEDEVEVTVTKCLDDALDTAPVVELPVDPTPSPTMPELVEEPVETPTATEIVEETPESPTPVPTEVPASVAVVSASVLFCDLTGTNGSTDAGSLMRICNLPGSPVTFSLTIEKKLVGSASAAGGGGVQWVELPAGYAQLSGSIPEASQLITIWCQVNAADGSVLTGYHQESIDAGLVVGAELPQGGVLHCDVFLGLEIASSPSPTTMPEPTSTDTPQPEPTEPEATNAASPPVTARIAQDDDGPGDPNLSGAHVTIYSYECLVPLFNLPNVVIDTAILDEPEPTQTPSGNGSVFDDIAVNTNDLEIAQPPGEFDRCTATADWVTYSIARRTNQQYHMDAQATGNPATAEFQYAYPDGVFIFALGVEYDAFTQTVICNSSVQGLLRFEGEAAQYGFIIIDLVDNEELTCSWYHQQLEPYGSIRIKTRMCENGEAIEASDLARLRAECDELMPLDITVGRSGGPPGITKVPVDFPNGAVWSELTPNLYTVTQYPGGIGQYGYPAVHCRSYQLFMPGLVSLKLMPVEGDSRDTVLLDVAPGYSVYCEWYVAKNGFIRLQDGDMILTVQASFCPPGLDRSSVDIYDLAAACHEPEQPVQVDILQYGGGTTTATTPGTIPNWAQFLDLAELPVTISMQVLPEYPFILAHCLHQDGVPGNGDLNFEPLEGPDLNQFPWALSYEVFGIDFCTVYYFPPEGAAPVTPPGDTQLVASTSSLVVNLMTCPGEFDLTGSEVDALYATCLDSLDGATVSITTGDDSSGTGTSVRGLVTFGDLGTGSMVVQLDSAASASRVVCSGADGAVTEMAVENAAFALMLGTGETMVCDWFVQSGTG